MKIISLTVLHYGKTYLGFALKSVLPYVDECWCLYTPVGSHGSRTDVPCPETRDELYAIASAVVGDKLRWHEGVYQHEGYHRDKIFELVPDADVIVVVDSDEIYATGLIPELIEQTAHLGKRAIRVPFVHFYRDFRHAIIHDPSFPMRIVYPQITGGEDTAHTRPVAHMGYCQPSEIIRYKLRIHGHRNQLRCSPDEYVDTVYLNKNRWDDLHPVGSEFWHGELVDPWIYMPDFMRAHPFAQMDVIL